MNKQQAIEFLQSKGIHNSTQFHLKQREWYRSEHFAEHKHMIPPSTPDISLREIAEVRNDLFLDWLQFLPFSLA